MRESTSSWAQNRNVVRHAPKKIGTISHSVILAVLVLIVGLIYTTQGTRVTNYDYELSELDSEISELEAKKEDLAVEKARLTSIAASSESEVAVNMEDASVSGYAE